MLKQVRRYSPFLGGLIVQILSQTIVVPATANIDIAAPVPAITCTSVITQPTTPDILLAAPVPALTTTSVLTTVAAPDALIAAPVPAVGSTSVVTQPSTPDALLAAPVPALGDTSVITTVAAPDLALNAPVPTFTDTSVITTVAAPDVLIAAPVPIVTVPVAAETVIVPNAAALTVAVPVPSFLTNQIMAAPIVAVNLAAPVPGVVGATSVATVTVPSPAPAIIQAVTPTVWVPMFGPPPLGSTVRFLVADISLSIIHRYLHDLDLVDPIDAMHLDHDARFTLGTGDSQANVVWADTRTVAFGVNDTVNLKTVTDAFSTAINLLTLRGLLLRCNTVDVTLELVAGADTINEFVGMKAIGRNGMMFWLAQEDGITIDNTHKNLIVDNTAGAGSATYDIWVMGTK